MDLANDDVLIEDLIAVAEGSASAVSAGVDKHGPYRVAEILLAEVADRTRLLPEPPEKVAVQFDLGFAEERLGYTLTLDAGAGEIAHGWEGNPPVVIRQDLVELLRAVFGPPGRHGSTREIQVEDAETMPSFDPNDPLNRRRANAVVATHQVIAALTQPPADLTSLAVHFDSDKWGNHWYAPNYERYFAPYRDERVKVLELGIGGYNMPDAGGASLRMWKHYFRRGLVYGLDIFEKTGIAETRLRTIQGDQGDPSFLAGLGTGIGPFDIIVDDGSHLSPHVITSFNALFPHVRPGGLYVIEDTQTSYWPGWGGSSTELNSPETSMGFVKQLIDGLNHKELVREVDHQPSYTDRTVTAVHVHHNMVVIEKGVNTEQSAPAWLPRDIDPMTLFDQK